MPAHVSHVLFAKEAWRRRGMGEVPEDNRGRALAFGAQGPDLFLHNQRSKPSGIEYGILLHSRGYGRFVGALAEALVLENGVDHEESFAYLFGFITHAFLDRRLHPYVNAKSGWVVRNDPATDRFHFAHAYLERVLDEALYREFQGRSLQGEEVLDSMDLGPTMPEYLITPMAAALVFAYPYARSKSQLRRRLLAAYRDTRNILWYTDPAPPDRRREAAAAEDAGALPRRALALFHPDELPDEDVLNREREPWPDPNDETRMCSESVLDLWEEAWNDLEPALTALVEFWAAARSAPADDSVSAKALAEAVGDGNLSCGNGKEGSPRKYRHDAFDIAAWLDAVYARWSPS